MSGKKTLVKREKRKIHEKTKVEEKGNEDGERGRVRGKGR